MEGDGGTPGVRGGGIAGSTTVRDETRRRVEARGWKVGTAQEFLRLTAEEAAYVELKVRLAMALRYWDAWPSG